MIDKPLQEEFCKLRQMVIDRDFESMNDKQKLAVVHTQGPLLVLAGAGSGKTTVIVNKIVNLIKYGNGYYSKNTPSFADEEDIAFLKEYTKKKQSDPGGKGSGSRIMRRRSSASLSDDCHYLYQ